MKPAQKAWSELGWQIVGAIVAAGVLLWGAWLTIDELEQGDKLAGVGKVGPCRALGIENEECQRQARLIFAACYLQREECREKYGLVLMIGVRKPTGAEGRNRGPAPEGSEPGVKSAQNRSVGVRTGGVGEGPSPGGGDVGDRGGSDDDRGDRGGSEGGREPDAGGAAPAPQPAPAGANPEPRRGETAPIATGAGPPAAGEAPVEIPTAKPGLVEGVTGAVEQAGKDVEGTVEAVTCNPLVSLCLK